jgi:YfiH family protein
MRVASTKKSAPAKRPKTANPVKAVKASIRGSHWSLHRAGKLQVLEAQPLARLNWLAHGFSTRPGGASQLEIPGHARGGKTSRAKNVLNLGFTEWDSRERVGQNRQKFFQALGADKMRAVMLKQIHSDLVRRIDDAHRASGEPLKGDALITAARGVLLVVQTADCVPILLADTKNRAVAAIHSGWRGTLRRIAEKTLGRMRMEFGTRPDDVIAAIGPSIGQCCYEVGSDVAKEFAAQFPDARQWFDGPFDALASGENDPNWLPWLTMRPPGHAPPEPKVQLDLIAANRWILANAGVPAAKIFSSEFCTACRTDLFFSYRRERSTGRLMAAIGIR